MRLKQVVLPAPLGPIRPTMAPSATAKLTPLTAVRPPNRTVRSSTSSSGTEAPPRPCPSPESPQPLGYEHDGDHEKRAEDHQARPLGHAQVLRQQGEEQRAEDGPRDAALAPHDHHAHDRDRVV